MTGALDALRPFAHLAGVVKPGASPRLGGFVVPVLLLALAGCADLEDLKLLGDSPPNPYLDENGAQRVLEARAIQQLDTALRVYLQSLTALAGGDFMLSSANMKEVNTGLTSLSKSVPAMELSDKEVSTVARFVQYVTDGLEMGYRNAELATIVRNHDADLQVLLAVQSKIVLRALRPSVVDVQKNLSGGGAREVMRFIDQDLQNWTVTPGYNAPPAHGPAAALFDGRNPAFRGQGEADAHVARYLFRKSIEADQQRLALALATADAYVQTLDAIGRAHKTLVLSGQGLLRKEVAQRLQPLADEVHRQWQAIAAQAALPAMP